MSIELVNKDDVEFFAKKYRLYKTKITHQCMFSTLLEYATRDDRLAGRHMGGSMYFYTDWETGIVVDYNEVVGIELTQAIAESVADGLSIKEAYEIAMI